MNALFANALFANAVFLSYHGARSNETELFLSIAIKIFAGLALLIFGRKIFWLFVAAVGFVGALTLLPKFFPDASGWTAIGIGIAGGVLGALLALFLQRVAVALAGFAGGGFFLVNIVEMFQIQTGSNFWIPMIVGGIIGAALMMLIFDWSLVILSSGLGAYLFVQELHLRNSIELAVMLALFVVGIVVQSKGMKKKGSSRTPKGSSRTAKGSNDKKKEQ